MSSLRTVAKTVCVNDICRGISINRTRLFFYLLHLSTHYILFFYLSLCGLYGPLVRALHFCLGCRGFDSRDNPSIFYFFLVVLMTFDE